MAPKRVDPRKVKYFEDRAEFLLRKCPPAEREEFVKMTFLELIKDGWSLCTHGRVATCIEKMIPYASEEAIGCLLKTFTKEMKALFNTKSAHHVLHAALRQCALHVELRKDSLICSCIDEYLDFMQENYLSLLREQHSAPALRTYIQLLSGVSVPKSPHTGLYDVTAVTISDPLDPQSYQNKIIDLTNLLLLSQDFNFYVRDAMSSAFLQILLIICSRRMESDFEAICSTIMLRSKLLSPSEDAEILQLYDGRTYTLPMGFSDPVAVFFTVTLISLLPGRQIQNFLKENFLTLPVPADLEQCPQVSIASALAGHENACRVLRAAVRATKRAADLESIMSALQLPGSNGKPGLEVALAANQHYLLIALAEACRRINGSSAERVQATCERMLFEAFGWPLTIKKPDDRLIKSFVRLRRIVNLDDNSADGGEVSRAAEGLIEEEDETEKQSSPIDETSTSCQLAGCLLAEEVLGFMNHRPTRLAASLAALPPNEMFAWARNCMLHRVLECALLSPSVPDQRKLHIFECLKPYLGSLAMDQSGSRVVEALWHSGDIVGTQSSNVNTMSSIREEMAKILAPLSDRLAAAKFGRFVENLIGSAAYRANPQLWRKSKLGIPTAAVAHSTDSRSAKGTAKKSFKRKLPMDFRKQKRLEEKQNRKAKRISQNSE
ncbi:hypothetical protein Aperf_G00000024970 [Anoplocephala perfoliata]